MGTHVQPPPRRNEALAVIIDRLVRTGFAPTYLEIGLALGVGESRARQLVQQLIEEGLIEKVPGALRVLRLRDVARARQLAAQFAGRLGWTFAAPPGAPAPSQHRAEPGPPCARVQLSVLPPFEHLPDPD